MNEIDEASASEGEGRVLAVRALPGANCSSVGSVIDLLFVAGVAGGALLVAVTAALRDAEVAARDLAEERDEDAG